MIPEEKLFEKLRKVLIADSIINGYVEKRVYLTHPSTIKEPKYPAISMFYVQTSADVSVITQAAMEIQFDVWLDGNKHTNEDLLIIQRRIRALLHRQNLSDTSIDNLIVQQSLEAIVGPPMYEQDTDLLHLPLRYNMVAI